VGAGPAGLEAARAFGLRGYQVMLAEAARDLGGRVTREAALPGLSEYARVRDYREQQLQDMTNVEIFRESRMDAASVAEVGADHVVIATGARWRADLFDGERYVALAGGAPAASILTPDDIMDGSLPTGPVLVYDSDGYYMGSVMAERLRSEGLEVHFATPSDSVSPWSGNTSERWRVRSRLTELGVDIATAHELQAFDGVRATLACAYGGGKRELAVAAVVLVTARRPSDDLYHEILAGVGGDASALPFSLARIGDCEAPAIIAAAVYAGHRHAQEFERVPDRDDPLRHDRIDVGRLDASEPCAPLE
jgi:dimethylamine/trimethylamine dehydrogenase